MIKYLYICLIFLEFLLSAQQNIDLSGHLDAGRLEKPKEQIETAKPQEEIVLTINSASGDLMPVLGFARHLYQAKIERNVKVIVYINESAIGPSAILPLLADERYGSLYLSWGDIPLNNESVLPANILKTQVTGLISENQHKEELLHQVAAAMSDPSYEMEGEDSSKTQTLVLNQNQVQKLGLVTSLMTLKDFNERFASEQTPSQAAVPVSALDTELAKHIKFNPNGSNKIGYLKITGHDSMISQSTWIYIKKGLEYYKETKPAFIIIELDTPGGEVFAAQKISDALKEMDTQLDIPVVSFINNWAISAGAMIAYSTRFITVVKDGSMGAAEPVIAGESGKMESASEKVNSALRADFANRARFFDRNPDIAEAMVDKDMILVLRNGKVIKLDSEDAIRKTGPNPDKIISNKGKLLTLNAQEMLQYGVADILLPPTKLLSISEYEQATGSWPADKMLLSQNPFFKAIPDATIDAYQMDWKTQFLVLLTSPMVASALFLGMILGFYIEFNTPGFGLPGTVGITCLALIVISSFALEIGNILELVLVAIGIGMILAEIFVLPGVGIMGVIGALFFIGGVLGLLIPNIGEIDYEYDTGTFNAAGEVVLERLAWLSGTIILAVILMALLSRYLLPSFAGYNRLVLRGGEQDASDGYYAGESPDQLPQPGQRGIVNAPLRPAGKIEVDGVYYDATSTGDFLDSGTKVVVKSVVGNVIVVDKQDKSE